MSYIKEIIFTAIFCGIIVKLAPTGKSGTDRFVRYAASLAFLCIVASPLTDLAKMDFDLAGIYESEVAPDIADDYTGSYDVVSRAICVAAASSASEHFSVPADSFSMRIIIDEESDGEYSIREAEVYVTGEGAKLDAALLEVYFCKILNTEEVTVKIE